MSAVLDAAGRLCLRAGAITLRGLTPVVNGVALAGDPATHDAADGALALRFTDPALRGGTFAVSLRRTGPEAWEVRYALEGLPDDFTLDAFGLRFDAVENLRAYLRSGYFSWDGSAYVPAGPPADDPPTGYAMTQLLPRLGEGAVVVGFTRHDRFQHTFRVAWHAGAPALTVLTLWDRRRRALGEPCASEPLFVFYHDDVEDGLRAWAAEVAAASPVPPRVPDPPITGWSSWYNLYASITDENLREHLAAAAEVARREALPMRYFQIDDGFTPEMGDWLDVKPQFPRGMKPLLDEVRAAGFTPGLWIAPFAVGNRSRLYREHPDWVVMDRVTGRPLVLMDFYGEFRWHKRSEEYYVLDTTHPDAFAYLRRVFHTWRHEWGCAYFKTDFMHFATEHGPDRAVWHTPGLTRIEIWRQVAEMIRAEIGDAAWMGCGCPLWASVGLVDAVRIGRDVGVRWSGGQSAESLLRDQATRGFANRILWLADPDCILLRERFHHLTESEVTALALYAAMGGGVVMTSDHLGELSPARLRLWKLALSAGPRPCRYPLLGQDAAAGEAGHGLGDPVLVQVRDAAPDGDGPAAVHILNAGDAPVQRTYPLASLRLPAPAYVYDWGAGAAWPEPVDALAVSLEPHASVLLFVSAAPFEAAPTHLP